MPASSWQKFIRDFATWTGLRRQGFFIPYRYADRMAAPATYEAAEKIFAAERVHFAARLDELAHYSAELSAIGVDAPAPAPRWGQDWFGVLDAAMLYVFVRKLQPRRLLEIGTGHSTRFVARAIVDGKLTTKHIAIDPAPRADCSKLAIEHHPVILKDADKALFAALQSGDILFIDSSHILMPGTDVDQLFNGVLPALPKGVVIHIHDVFMPDNYPASWAWRGYNEQLTVLPLLTSKAFRPLFASHYVETRMKEETAASLIATLPSSLAPATSLWLEKA